MTKIIIIGTYFGSWPTWFPAFLLSSAKNELIQWLFFTDCEIPNVDFPNVRFEHMTLEDLNVLASRRLELDIRKGAYSHVDLQPAFGEIFADYIKGYDFWGHCDLDIVWGNIRAFITEEILQNHDIITCREGFLAGHLTLWRNTQEINLLFRKVPGYREIVVSSEHFNFDENVISTFLKKETSGGSTKIRIYWPGKLLVRFGREIDPIGWEWEDGRVFDTEGREYVYLHFQHWHKYEWRGAVTSVGFAVGEQVNRFKFTYSGIQSDSSRKNGRLHKRNLQPHEFHIVDGRASGLKDVLLTIKKFVSVQDYFWARMLVQHRVNPADAEYRRQSKRLYLKQLDLEISEQEQFVLDVYQPALYLKEKRQARFVLDDETGDLHADVGGFRIAIRSAQDIVTIQRILVDGIYDYVFTRPALVLDIGMANGISTLHFASHPNVLVIGYEPSQGWHQQALHNINLNPRLSDSIRTDRSTIGCSNYRSIAGYRSRDVDRPVSYTAEEHFLMGPSYEYEEVEIRDAVDVLDSAVTKHPEREIVMRIDYRNPDYYIDGVSENTIIQRLHATGKLELIDALMIDISSSTSDHGRSELVSRLVEHEFTVFQNSPYTHSEETVYAIRRGMNTGLYGYKQQGNALWEQQ